MKNKKQIVKTTYEATVRSVLGEIPIVGTALTEMFDFSGNLKRARLEKFFESLAQYFESVSENEIDVENIKTEDFHDLFEMILIQVSRTKAEEKIERFKRIVVNQIKNPSDIDVISSYVWRIRSK